jgi:hypothetical protein
LQTVPVSYLAAYRLILYQVNGLLTKKEQKVWKDLQWSLTFENEYLQENPDKEENLDKEENPDEKAKETESDREEEPTPDTTPKPAITPRKSERLSEEKKKPVEEKKPQFSARFVPKMEETGAQIPEDYEASRRAKQTICWANKTASKLDKLEAHLKEAAGMLYYELKNLMLAIKEKIKTCNRVEDLEIQRKRDLKKIEELQKANTRLRTEKSPINKQLEDEKKRKDWEEKALSQLEEANLTVKKLFKFDAASRIQKDTIEEFLEKGDMAYIQIFNTISKFAFDIDESLSDFSSAFLSMRHVMHKLSKEFRSRRPELW